MAMSVKIADLPLPGGPNPEWPNGNPLDDFPLLRDAGEPTAARGTTDEPPPPTSEADYGFAGGQQQERREAHGKFEPLPLTFYRDLKEAKRKDWNIKNVMARGEVSSWQSRAASLAS